jgi:hypothetical protein
VDIRRLHPSADRLLTASRFAGPLPLPGFAHPRRKEGRRNSSETPNPNFYVAHPAHAFEWRKSKYNSKAVP